MQNLHLNIIEVINSNAERFTDLDLTPIRTIDIYNGQPEAAEEFEFLSPAIFVDYSIDWERGGSAHKMGIITLDVHIVTDPRPGTEDWSSRKNEGIKRTLYYSLIGELLESTSSSNTGSLCLIGENPKQTDYFDYHILTFDTTISRQKGRELTPTPNIKPKINA